MVKCIACDQEKDEWGCGDPYCGMTIAPVSKKETPKENWVEVMFMIVFIWIIWEIGNE